MKLLLLRCPVCAEPMAPDHQDAVVYDCASCQTPITIKETGLGTATVQFVAPAQAEVDHITDWMPFWRFEGRVHIEKRQTQGGRNNEDDAAQLWGERRRLFVPAWTLDMHKARDIGSTLAQRQPLFVPIERPSTVRMKTATVTAADALKMLEFIIITIEAQRDDWLRDLEFSLELDEPTLYAIPAENKEGQWHLIAQIEAELQKEDNGLISRYWPF